MQHKLRQSVIVATAAALLGYFNVGAGRAGAWGKAPTMAFAQKKTSAAPLKHLYEIGEVPPLGHIPENMYAWAIRKERHGPPETAMQCEVVPTWPIADDEVLVYVVAGGVNYRGVGAGLGVPVSPRDGHKPPFQIPGGDASGVVWAVGPK